MTKGNETLINSYMSGLRLEDVADEIESLNLELMQDDAVPDDIILTIDDIIHAFRNMASMLESSDERYVDPVIKIQILEKIMTVHQYLLVYRVRSETSYRLNRVMNHLTPIYSVYLYGMSVLAMDGSYISANTNDSDDDFDESGGA